MQNYQKRVVEEKKELDERTNRLNNFIQSESYNDLKIQERILLDKQLTAMHKYSNILNQRINMFPVNV